MGDCYKVSQKGWTKSKEAVIVNDNAIVDALAATPFADAKDAPILLTGTNKLDERTKTELKRLGVIKVYLIGGKSILSENIEKELESEKISIDRISGDDRYLTALELAKRLDSIKSISEIAVVNGYKGLADAVSIAAVAAEKDMAIILSNANNGTSDSDQFIKDKGIKKSYVIGGKSVISDAVVNKLPGATRIAGDDRSETNAKIVETFYTERDLKNAYIAKDGMKKEDELIDALSVGVLAAKNDAPVILVGNKLNDMQKNVINTKSFTTVTKVGGNGNEAAFDELKSIQAVTTYNVKTVEELNTAISKSDANDVINMAPASKSDINEDVIINTDKAIAINLSGNYKKIITITASNAKIVNKGTIAKLVVKDSKGGSIENEKGSKITSLEVQGTSNNVDIVNKGTVTTVKNDATGTTVDNTGGKIEKPLEGSQKPPVIGNKPSGGGSTGGGSSSGNGGSNTDTTKPIIENVAFKRDTTSTGTLSVTSNEDGTYYYVVTDDNNTMTEKEVISKAIEDNTTGSLVANTAKTMKIQSINPGEQKIHIVVKDKSNNVSSIMTKTLTNILTPSEINILSENNDIIDEINAKNKENVKINVVFNENTTGLVEVALKDSNNQSKIQTADIENLKNKDVIVDASELSDGKILVSVKLIVGDKQSDSLSKDVMKITTTLEAPTKAVVMELDDNKENIINSFNVDKTTIAVNFEKTIANGSLEVELNDGENILSETVAIKEGDTSANVEIDTAMLIDSEDENGSITISSQLKIGDITSDKFISSEKIRKDVVAPIVTSAGGITKNNHIYIFCEEELDEVSLPSPEDFEVRYVMGGVDTKQVIDNIEVDQKLIVLTMSRELERYYSPKLSYKGSENKIKDTAGNVLIDFEDISVDVSD